MKTPNDPSFNAAEFAARHERWYRELLEHRARNEAIWEAEHKISVKPTMAGPDQYAAPAGSTKADWDDLP